MRRENVEGVDVLYVSYDEVRDLDVIASCSLCPFEERGGMSEKCPTFHGHTRVCVGGYFISTKPEKLAQFTAVLLKGKT